MGLANGGWSVHNVLSTAEFLRLVTPQDGEKSICVITGTSAVTGRPTWRNYRAPDADALAEIAMQQDATGRPVYFALAGFVPGTLEDYAGRKHANVSSLRSLWIDIDVAKDDIRKYDKISVAGVKVTEFARATGLPDPLIVVSGGGVHAYWPLSEDVSKAEWQPVADQLKVAARGWGLKFDPTRTGDSASVLRPVGTTNRKRDKAKMVTHVPTGFQIVPLAHIGAMVGAVAVAADPMAAALSAIPEELYEGAATNAAITNLAIHPRSAKLIFMKCAQMRNSFLDMKYGSDGVAADGTTGTPVPEPLWLAGISVLARCTNGRKHAHTYSKPYPGYSADEVDDKLRRFSDSPRKCSTFNEQNPGGCIGCPHIGKITSPLQLGVAEGALLPEEPPPTTTIRGEAIVELKVPKESRGFAGESGTESTTYAAEEVETIIECAPPRYPYRRVATGLAKVSKEPKVDEQTGEKLPGLFIEVETVFSHYDIYPTIVTDTRRRDEDDATLSVHWQVGVKGDPLSYVDVVIPKTVLASDAELKSFLYSHTPYAAATGEHMIVAEYMRAYVKQLKPEQTQRVAMGFGWENTSRSVMTEEMSFVTGRTRIRRKRDSQGRFVVVDEPCYPDVGMTALLDRVKPKGTLEGWAKAAAFYGKTHATYKHVVAALCGMGSPMIYFTGERSSIVVMNGTSGCGKSKVQEFIASAWADPSPGNSFVMAGDSTNNARMIHLGAVNNLPALAEDVQRMERDELSKFIMSAANGEERMRAKVSQGTTELQARRTWCTTTVVSTNHDWRNILASVGVNAEGEYGRLVQINMDRVPDHLWGNKYEFNEALAHNHGVVGPVLVRRFLANPERELKRLNSYSDTLCKIIDSNAHTNPALKNFSRSEMRIFLATMCTALWTLYHLRQLKLVDWEPALVVQAMIELLTEGTETFVESRVESTTLLGQFVNENYGNLALVTHQGVTPLGVDAAEPDAVTGKMALNKIVGRVDNILHAIEVASTSLRVWLLDRGVSMKHFTDGLIATGHTIEKQQLSLTRGFAFEIKMARTEVYVIKGYSTREIVSQSTEDST